MKTLGFFLILLSLLSLSHQQQANNRVGGNIDGITDYSRGHAFCDLVKQSRTFGLPSLPWVVNDSVQIGSDGWPTSDFGVILWIDVLTPMNGTYKVSFDSSVLPVVKLAASGGSSLTNIVFDAVNNRVTADLITAFTGQQVMMSFTNTNNGVKNLRVIRPECNAQNPALFTQHFLDHHALFNTLRFMDFGRTNGNSLSKWVDRTPCTWPTMTKSTGVCLEYMIQLANQIQKDMWINIPYYADDDYVVNLANLLKDQLNPSLNFYIELSNEIWNWQFSQATWNLNAARALGSQSDLNYDQINNEGYWAWRLPARRTREISNIFRSVFGDASMMTRVRPVLAGQIAYSEGMKTALEYINNVYGDPSQYFYAISGAPYFSSHTVDNKNNSTVDEIINALNASANDFSINTNMLDYITAATTYNLSLTAYEAGPDTFGPNNIQNKKSAHFDPRMQQISERYLELLFSYGFDLVNWFVVGPTNCDTQYGCWGVTDLFTKLNVPKLNALINTINKPKIGLNIGFSVPCSLDGRQSVGSNFYSTTWQTAARSSVSTGRFVNYLFRSDQQARYYIVLSVSTNSYTKVRVKLNNGFVSDVELNSTSNAAVTLRYLEVNFKAGLNALRLTALIGSFVPFSVVVSFTKPVPVITSPLNQIVSIQSNSFIYQIIAINDATSFSSLNLPSGLSLDTTTGLIQGVPTVSGNFTVTLIAVNDGGQGTATLFLTIFPSLLLRESFEYTSGAGLHNLNSGYGFNGQWKVQNADSNSALSNIYSIQSSSPLNFGSLLTSGNYAIGGGSYLSSGRGIDASNTFSAFKETNGANIGTGGNLWISFLIRKTVLNNEECWISFHPSNSVTWATGATRISVGYFGSSSNDQSVKYWSIKYGDNTPVKTNKVLTVNQSALLVLKLELGASNNTDNAYLYVNPDLTTTTVPSNTDAQYIGVNIQFRSLVYYAGSSANQSSVDEIRIGINYKDVTPY